MHIEYRLTTGQDCLTHLVTEGAGDRLQPEKFAMVRPIVARHQTTNRPGIAWMVSTGQMVAFESRLESTCLLVLDFEGNVTAVSSQPLKIVWKSERAPSWHVPDFFARRRDGSGLLIDVKPQDRLEHPKVAAQLKATANVCEVMGWDYQVMHEPADHFRRNLAFLSGYRRAPLFTDEVLTEAADALSAGSLPWVALVGRCVATSDLPEPLVVPPLLHALWYRDLIADLTGPMTRGSLISARRDA